MSYDVIFVKDGNTCQLPEGSYAPNGGTYCVGGTREAWLNITYNYCKPYSKYGFGICHHDDVEDEVYLEGKTAKECVEILCGIIPKLNNDVDEDYWKATEGNAKKALINLLFIANSVPEDAICKVC